MVLNNEAKLMYDNEKKKVNRTGLPTEAALKVLAEKIGKYDPAFNSNIRSY
jgi:Ca2+-transporting ATPase